MKLLRLSVVVLIAAARLMAQRPVGPPTLEPGKRIKVRDFAIPSSLREADVVTFVDDIYHELAAPGQTVQLETEDD